MSRIPRDFQLTLQAALREAITRRHPVVTVEHLLYAFLFDDRGAEILRHCGANLAALRAGLERFFAEDLEPEPGEEAVDTQQTLAFHRVVQHAIQHMENAEKDELEVGDVLAAIFQEPDSHAVALLRAQGVSRLDVLQYVSHGISKVPDPGAESAVEGGAPRRELPGDDALPADPLAAFATNLTELATQGKLDPLVGRKVELDRVIHILARRRKNNPLFVGETGVGKTALAEGLAQRVLEDGVPEDLRGAEIYSLDLGSLLAGTKYRGDFEARFKAFVAAIRERPKAILFIDEIHAIVGAGAAQGGAMDASNMLKPLLQSGDLRCMGSTTYSEYRHLERDKALSRRFQRIDVAEPTEAEALKILRGLAPRYEAHHGARYTQSALKASVELSAKYLNDLFLPDKAIDVMDEAGAAMRVSPGTQGRKTVGLRDVEGVVARMARIPLARASSSDRERLDALKDGIRSLVYGQDDAIETVVRAIKRSRAGLGTPNRPVGSFLFMGPTGVGKTELSKQLAACLGVQFLRFDMSEYMEKHAVARLIGAPPGYVGYDEGGQLVDRIRKHPHAVLLLDEIEKAHPDLFDILLQVMDRAALTDNHGREADFRHVILIMTSNVGGRDMTGRAIGFTGGSRGSGKPAFEKLFSPEFRNRLDEVITFAALDLSVMERVVDKFVAEVEEQLRERKIRIALLPEARRWLAEKGYDPIFGARPLGRVIQTELKDRLADEVLFGALAKGGEVRVGVDADRLAFGSLRAGRLSSRPARPSACSARASGRAGSSRAARPRASRGR
jgi:ATP-dependent Clp protease ATP-binding subunit ClpA